MDHLNTEVENNNLSNKQTYEVATRYYDVDCLRSIALMLLIVYHCVVSFQPWAALVGFMPNEDTLEGLWALMAAINIWRIPILFVISGMGFAFAMQRRNWQQLLADRSFRILIPYVFGFFCIAPIHTYFLIRFYGGQAVYAPGAWHLWFLLNIFIYVLLLLPVVPIVKRYSTNVLFKSLAASFKIPFAILLLAIPIIIEVLVVQPDNFPTYANTGHGFWLGLCCFAIGFVLIATGEAFWQAVNKQRFIMLAIANVLFFVRLSYFEFNSPNVLNAIESMAWMLALFGFANRHLNQPSKVLRYLSSAVYPVYIVHMPVQFAVSFYVLPLELSAVTKLVILIVSTFAISFLLYELLKRLKWVRPLFGMKFVI